MRSSKETNKILEQAVKWPPKLRKSNGVNRLPIFKDLLYSVSKVLKRENRGEGTISVGFWQRLLTDMWGEVPLAEKQTIAGAVKEGFRLFREDHPNSNHNGDLFTTGLEVAGLTRDSGLAKDLLFKYVDAKVALADNKGDSGIADKLPTVNDIAFVGDEAELTSPGIDNDQFGSILGSSDKDLNLYLPSSVKVRPPSISQSAVSKVLEIALSAQDVDSVQEILSAFEGSLSSMPVSSKNTLYSLGVKGIARIGEPDDALCLLNNMYANGLSPCEVTCGAVIYCLAHANRVTEANSLFDDVSEGKFGKNIMPGLACFNAHMLSLMKMKNWEDVVRLQQTMKEAGISPDATTFQGVLIASTKHGDDNAVLGVVEDALKNGWKMNRECIDLTTRILLKDLNLPTNSTAATRDKLRMLIDQRGELQNEYLDLLRTLRTAEVEDSREGPKFVRLEDIRVRQETAWRAVLESLITLSKKKSRSCNESVLKRSI
jgi:pentatricopeptide repeat protein